MGTAVKEIQDSDFAQEVINQENLVLVYFWAPWCGPCRLVSPSIDWAAQTYSDRLKVVKLEIDPNPEAVALCKVQGVPALRLFKNQDLLALHEGAITKRQLEGLITPYLDNN